MDHIKEEDNAIKQEENDNTYIPEGLLPSLDIDVPVGFECDEWNALTEVINTAVYHSIC
jgi:hypothetical protein